MLSHVPNLKQAKVAIDTTEEDLLKWSFTNLQDASMFHGGESRHLDVILSQNPALLGKNSVEIFDGYCKSLRPGGRMFFVPTFNVKPEERHVILEQAKASRFKEVVCKRFWSPELGYLGEDVLFIQAQKPLATRKRAIPSAKTVAAQ